MPIQWLDVILILVMLISAFLAMQRGLTREMLSLISWALAALVALFIYQIYRERVHAAIQPQVLADLLLIGLVFLIVLLVLGVVFWRLFPTPEGQPGVVDRILGFVFGLVRGFFLAVIAYELITAVEPKESLPHWVTEARSLPIIERTGRSLLSLLPDNPASIFRSGERLEGGSAYERQAALRVRSTHSYKFQRERRLATSATAG
jgi:membrane protein required for colicin V production